MSITISPIKNDVLLVAYDNVIPSNLECFRHFEYPVGIALLLSAAQNYETKLATPFFLWLIRTCIFYL
jgi:hypothetical protein